MVTAYLAIGANLGKREDSLASAVLRLGQQAGNQVAHSGVYETVALTRYGVDDQSQPRYLNAVISLNTELSPQDLLKTCLSIESELGRIRSNANGFGDWQSRTIDIDILSYGDFIVNQRDLIIPHAEMHKRDFVLIPLKELAPDWRHPANLETVSRLIESLELRDNTLVRMAVSAQEFELLVRTASLNSAVANL